MIVVVLGLVGAGVLVAAGFTELFNQQGAATAATTQAAKAKIVQAAQCGVPTSRDLVEVTVNGRSERMPFDGCGHTVGQVLDVQVPAQSGADAVAEPVGADGGGASAAAGLDHRLTWVLGTIAGVAGAGYALMLRRRSRTPSSRTS